METFTIYGCLITKKDKKVFNHPKYMYEYGKIVKNIPYYPFYSSYFSNFYSIPFFYEQKGPPYTIEETETAQILAIELPGVYKKDIKITLENDQLRTCYRDIYITGSRDEKRFSCSFTVIKYSNVTASYENGILTIILYREKHDIKEIKIN